LDEVFSFRNSVMPVRLLVGVSDYQWIEKRGNIAKRDMSTHAEKRGSLCSRTRYSARCYRTSSFVVTLAQH